MNRKNFLISSKRYSNTSHQSVHFSRHQCANGFECKHCHAYILLDSFVSGVNNRNHCPFCLWSKHVDLFKAGDRLAACKGLMQPVGLSLKQTHKKYAQSPQGELMLIHRCTGCGDFSINRIAADDDADRMLEVFDTSFQMEDGDKYSLNQHGILMLTSEDKKWVYHRLFGKECIENKYN
jgi:hypothetical protein